MAKDKGAGSGRIELPSVQVPEALDKLIRDIAARDHGGTLSTAIRELLKESPRVKELATERGIPETAMAMGGWGGSRNREWLRYEWAKAEIAVIAVEVGAPVVNFDNFRGANFDLFVTLPATLIDDLLTRVRALGVSIELEEQKPTARGLADTQSKDNARFKISVPAGWTPPQTSAAGELIRKKLGD